MASLYKRANARQRRILTIVEGAVKNAADHHPEFECYSPRLARSIAKRAAGTLTAEWPKVLATPKPTSSDKPRKDTLATLAGPPGSHRLLAPENEQGITTSMPAPGGAVTDGNHRAPPFPIRKLIRRLSRTTGKWRKGDMIQQLQAEGLIEALRIIASLQKDR